MSVKDQKWRTKFFNERGLGCKSMEPVDLMQNLGDFYEPFKNSPAAFWEWGELARGKNGAFHDAKLVGILCGSIEDAAGGHTLIWG